ncbi:MAG TPA: hypothetical protein VNO55_18025 [Polyangia bacterium]|nr:hypothetical protein [Polyangia bacterium]
MKLSAKVGLAMVGMLAALSGAGCGGSGARLDAKADARADARSDAGPDQGQAVDGAGGAGTGGSVADGPAESSVEIEPETPADLTTGHDLAAEMPADLVIAADVPREAASESGLESGVDAPADGAVDLAPDSAADGADAATEVAAETSADASPEGTSDGGAVATAKRLLSGRARLVGTPTTACSSVPKGAAPAEQWCAFTLPGQTLGSTELWVLNVSKALTETVACDGTSAACLRLTTALWTGQPDSGPVHPLSHHFYGQTLVFYAAPVVGINAYDGPVFAWRPGLSAPRQISGAHAFVCDGHPRADVAVCLEDLQLNAIPGHFDVHAGRIAATPLPLAATIYPSSITNASQWSLAFSAKGDYFAYSTGGPSFTDAETLYASKVDEVGMPAKRLTVASGASQWDITPDGKHWFFMRNFNYPPRNSVVDPAGTLVMADFPAGGGEKTIASRVASYLLMGDDASDRGVAFLDNVFAGRGTYKIISNPSQSTTPVTVAAGVLGVLGSPDGKFSLVQTQFDEATLRGDARVVRNDGTGNCALATGTTADVYGEPFLPGGGLVFWADNINPNTGAAEGWLAKPDGCTAKQKFADKLDIWFTVGDAGLIYSDNAGATTSTIRYVKLGAGGAWPAAGPTTIRAGAGRVFGLLDPDRQYIVYQLDNGGPDDGLWIYGPIGFGQP